MIPMVSRISSIIKAVRVLGIAQTWRYISFRLRPTDFVDQSILLHPRNSTFPLKLRGNTSDSLVFKQIFIDSEYEPLSGMEGVEVVLDCGANVGYSAAWFLSNFSNCEVIAVEPEESNFQALKENLKPFGSRVKVLNAAIWSKNTKLQLTRSDMSGFHEWAWQVTDSVEKNARWIPAMSVPYLIKKYGINRVSILKMDIEGAEAVVFSEPTAKQWIENVDSIAIELHDGTSFGPASDHFLDAMEGQSGSMERCGELTIYRRY